MASIIIYDSPLSTQGSSKYPVQGEKCMFSGSPHHNNIYDLISGWEKGTLK